MVNATKAVSATRNTLKESMKNCSPKAVMGPPLMIFNVSTAEATKVPKLISELSSGA
ncbi:hypothetical protein [Sulfurimicrobium lacus]|uniref:hypothetical protein n=1 Tax=Sulfurimicrobium lacus TaxID=2715678 RepID=UPI001FCE7009|nr:hypothetical protein [Sulfurimicrobium lacus]